MRSDWIKKVEERGAEKRYIPRKSTLPAGVGTSFSSSINFHLILWNYESLFCRSRPARNHHHKGRKRPKYSGLPKQTRLVNNRGALVGVLSLPVHGRANRCDWQLIELWRSWKAPDLSCEGVEQRLAWAVEEARSS